MDFLQQCKYKQMDATPVGSITLQVQMQSTVHKAVDTASGEIIFACI
jgi:hypothetical protein